ncbi:MAG: magnesium transporter [Rhodospirillales bacterium]|nr:magnesium transporter [Alphaproteobacteria bacterium]MCB9986022.1 magnesium transporter [Rhodospirillales bacterium]USO07404.1 MAG: magnesium transporter [Rhodospirillales bacterium]
MEPDDTRTVESSVSEDRQTPPVENEVVLDASLSDEAIASILTALDDGRDDDVRVFLEVLGPADRADLLAKIGPQDRAFLIDRFPHVFDAEVFSWLAPELARQTLEEMAPGRVAQLISTLETDDAVHLIEDLSPRVQKEILRKLSAVDREAVEESLAYPDDSAGRLMGRDFVAIPRFWTVGKTIDYLREAPEDDLPENFSVVFVIDPLYHVVGEIPLDRILRSRRAVKIEDLALDAIHPIPAETDQEDVARLFQREELSSAPVVDANNRIIGVITVDDVVSVITEEAQEDILRLGGVGESDMHRPLVPTAVSRFWWLAINLGTAFLASSVVGLFEGTLQKIVALAVLMPIVAGMGGNAGTQTLTVAVRALAMRELSRTNMARMIFKETAVGFLNGTAFALITGIIAAWWFSNPLLGVVIGLAMTINLVAAGLFGIMIPLALQKMRIDPALASAVFLTTVTDVVGFFTFLGLATLLMR